jgi:hypothetical protein
LKITIDESNLKRKENRKNPGKKLFFSKTNKLYISIHSPLNTEEQNKIKKNDIKIDPR